MGTNRGGAMSGARSVGSVGVCALAWTIAGASSARAADAALGSDGVSRQLGWFLHKAVGRVADNLHDLATSWFNPNERFFLGYLALSLFVFGALVFLRYEREARRDGFLRFLFPRDIYLHRSARVDYGVFLINKIFTPAVLVTRLWTATTIATVVTGVLIATFGAFDRIPATGLWAAVAITVIGAMISDFGDYLIHALHHRIPLLWEFHKLHHSAEVMTPITVARVHPIEQIVGASISTLFTGLGLGIAGYFFLEQPEPILFFGAQAVSALFMAAGSHLRHSHIWLSWGPILERIVISPAQHQIHHSVASHHLDHNYGFIFALWDWMFGTIYITHGKETLTYGLGVGVREHATVWAAYIDPIKAATRVLGRWLAPGGRAWRRTLRDDAAAR